MFSLEFIPLYVFLAVLIPISIVGFFKGLKWSLFLLTSVLIAGLISFLIFYFAYDSLTWPLMKKLLQATLPSDIHVSEINDYSKATAVGIMISFALIPIGIIVFIILKVLKRWLVKPLKPEVIEKESPNSIKITRKNTLPNKISGGVVTIGSGLIIASTAAIGTSILVTAPRSNQILNKITAPLSWLMNYGNHYDQTWQDVYSVLKNSKKHDSAKNELRELFDFPLLENDITKSKKDKIKNNLENLKHDAAFKPWLKDISESPRGVEMFLRSIINKNAFKGKNIIAHNELDIQKEKDYQSFVDSLSRFATQNNKYNLGLNKEGIKNAVSIMLNNTHDFNKSIYVKNDKNAKNVLESAKNILDSKIKSLVKAKKESLQAKQEYDSTFNKIKDQINQIPNEIQGINNSVNTIGTGTFPNLNFDNINDLRGKLNNSDYLWKNFSNKLDKTYNSKDGTRINVPEQKILDSRQPYNLNTSSNHRGLIQEYNRLDNILKNKVSKLAIANTKLINAKQNFYPIDRQKITKEEVLQTEKAELNNLNSELQELRANLSETQSNLYNANNNINKYNNEKQNNIIHKQNLQNDLANAENNKQDLNNKITILKTKLGKILSQNDFNQSFTFLNQQIRSTISNQEKEKFRAELNSLQNKRKDLTILEGYESDLTVIQNKIDDLNKNKIPSVASKIKINESNLQSAQNKKTFFDSRISDINNKIYYKNQKIVNKNNDITIAKSDLESYKRNVWQKAKDDLDQKEREKQRALNEKDSAERNVNNIRNNIEGEYNNIESLVRKIKNQLNEAKTFVDTNSKQLWDTYAETTHQIYLLDGETFNGKHIAEWQHVDPSIIKKDTDISKFNYLNSHKLNNPEEGSNSIFYQKQIVAWKENMIGLYDRMVKVQKDVFNDRIKTIASSFTELLS